MCVCVLSVLLRCVRKVLHYAPSQHASQHGAAHIHATHDTSSVSSVAGLFSSSFSSLAWHWTTGALHQRPHRVSTLFRWEHLHTDLASTRIEWQRAVHCWCTDGADVRAGCDYTRAGCGGQRSFHRTQSPC